MKITGLGSCLLFIAAAAMLFVPPRWAPLPLLAGICCIPMGIGIEVGLINLQAYRLLLMVGLVRVFMRGERLNDFGMTVDKMICLWAAWVLLSSFSHEFAPGSGPVYTLGIVINIALIYFFGRIWCRDVTSINVIVALMALVLMPIALEMVYEVVAGKNLFGEWIGTNPTAFMREGDVRARGPFRHPILAGTVGASCFPLMVGIWRQYRFAAIFGIVSCLVIVVTSNSSGPLVSLFAGLAMLFAWRYRKYATRAIWWGIAGYVFIDLVSSRHGYDVIFSRADMTGSSTGHYRARIIDATIEHFSEWWLFGTDRTRHWIPKGIGSVVADGRHMDITNYYIFFAVLGGMISMMLLIVIIGKCLAGVIKFVNNESGQIGNEEKFAVWCFGTSLTILALSGLSISYFDQSQVFFWLTVAALTSILGAQNGSKDALFERVSTDVSVKSGKELQYF